MAADYSKIIADHYRTLLRAIDPTTNLINSMRRPIRNIISKDEAEKILEKPSTDEKIQSLLMLLVDGEEEDHKEARFVGFRDALRVTGQEHIANLFDASSVHYPDKLPMSEEHWQALNGKLVNISKVLDPECDIVETLASMNVFTTTDCEKVSACRPYYERAEEIVKIIMRKSDAAYSSFIDALQKVGQEQVIYVLSGDGTVGKPPVREVFLKNMKKERVSILDCMEPKISGLLDMLVSGGVINDREYDRIGPLSTLGLQPVTNSDMNTALLRSLQRRPQESFDKFIVALIATQQNKVAQLIVGEEINGKIIITFSDQSDETQVNKTYEELTFELRKLSELDAESRENDLKRVLCANDITISYVKHGSIKIGFRCSTVGAVHYLRELYTNGDLDRLLNDAYFPLFSTEGIVSSIKFSIAVEEFDRCTANYERNQLMSPAHRRALLFVAKTIVVSDELLNRLSLDERRTRAVKESYDFKRLATLLQIMSRQPDSSFDLLIDALWQTSPEDNFQSDADRRPVDDVNVSGSKQLTCTDDDDARASSPAHLKSVAYSAESQSTTQLASENEQLRRQIDELQVKQDQLVSEQKKTTEEAKQHVFFCTMEKYELHERLNAAKSREREMLDTENELREIVLQTSDEVQRLRSVKLKADSCLGVVLQQLQQLQFSFQQTDRSHQQLQQTARRQPTVSLASMAYPQDGDFVTTIKYAELLGLQNVTEGGFSVVYRGWHHVFKEIAYKELKTSTLIDRNIREMKREAAAHRFEHPNIVKMLALVCEEGHCGMLFEFVQFGDLRQFIDNYEVGSLVAMSFAGDVARGLAYLHHTIPNPVVHGDIKVQNVLIDEGFVAKICDFGLMKCMANTTRETEFRGTVSNIPPECWEDINAPRTVKFDVYGFSIFLWELFSQRSAYETVADNAQLIRLAVTQGQRPAIDCIRECYNPCIPDDMFQLVEHYIHRCWVQNPNDRPAIAEVSEAFDKFLNENNAKVDGEKARLKLEIGRMLSIQVQADSIPTAKLAYCDSGDEFRWGHGPEEIAHTELEAKSTVQTIKYAEMEQLVKIAEGGFCTILRGWHRVFNVIAYKQLKTSIIDPNSRMARELQREVQLRVLRHQNIVAILGVVFEPGEYGIVMEYATFGCLDAFIEQYSVGLMMKMSIAHGIVHGMNYLHTNEPPVIHGDLKMQNVLVADGYVAKICDFGLSKWKQFSTTKTGSRTLRGTVTNIPPEQWGNINLSRTVKYDVYGFGILMYELLSEMPAFANAQGNADQIKVSVVGTHRPNLNDIVADKPDSEVMLEIVKDNIKNFWAQDPNDRPTFAEVKSIFNTFMATFENQLAIAKANLDAEIQQYSRP